MSEAVADRARQLALPAGFLVGHVSGQRSGVSAIVCPQGTCGAVDVRGGGTATRELEPLTLTANTDGPNVVLLCGGSAFGLVAADGAMRWLEQRGVGRMTPSGAVVPLVSAAAIFDQSAGSPPQRPTADDGYEACRLACGGVPERGGVGAGVGAAAGKLLGRRRASAGGVGYAALGCAGVTVAALAVVNPFGDVLGADGRVLAGPRGERGELLRSVQLIARMQAENLPLAEAYAAQNTTLVCVCTDAVLDKRACGIVARTASAGIARAVDPAFTPVDGDVTFCLASASAQSQLLQSPREWALTSLGAFAASVVADAIRDAILQRRAAR